MGSLLERLEAREQTVRARVEGLRAELGRLTEQLAAEEELLERLAITRQTITELLADGDGAGLQASLGTGLGVGVGIASALPALASPLAATATAAAAAAGSPAPMGMQVPVFVPGGGAAGRLPVAYRDALEVLADARVGLRAMQVCQALGTGTEPRHREGTRVRLKRLVKRGWLVEPAPGLFTCATGVPGELDAASDRSDRRG